MGYRVKGGGGTAAPGSTNIQEDVTPALDLSLLADVGPVAQPTPAAAITQGPFSDVVHQSPAAAISTRASGAPSVPPLLAAPAIAPRLVAGPTTPLDSAAAISSRLVAGPTIPVESAAAISTSADGAVQETCAPALNQTTVLLMPQATTDLPAFNLVQTVISLVGTYPSDAVTQEAATRSDWTDLASAEGAPGAGSPVSATLTSNALGGRSGRLVLNYPDSVDKSQLTISKVELHYYVAQSGTVLSNGNLQLGYRFGAGGITTLATHTGNVNFLSSPDVYDVTSAVAGDWGNIDAIAAAVTASYGLGIGITASTDAVLLVVTASRSDAL